ncbi:MAG: nitronate monooxygenase [Acidimicrobiaceae bacterium]
MTDAWPTAFTELVGCRVPIQQAGMGGASTVALAAAVAEAGALGMLAPHGAPPEQVAADLDAVATVTGGAFGINFLIPFVSPSAVEAAAEHCRYIDFFYGDPDEALVARAASGGAVVGWQVGSADEAVRAVEVGCKLVIAQGTEAGGHVRGALGLIPLLDAVLDRVDVSVVAAGGIATARAVAAVLAAGAAAVRVGTRFATSIESGAHPDYVAALLAADGADTVLTEAFGVGWPHAPHRVLRVSVEAATAFEGEVVGSMATPDGPRPVGRFSPEAPRHGMTGSISAMALYAGQAVGAVTRIEAAADVVDELATGAARLLAPR